MRQFLPKTSHDFLLIIILLLAPATVLFWGYKITYVPQTAISSTVPAAEEQLQGPNPFDTVALTAKAAYVYDVGANQVIYEKNADTPLPLASITKIMTTIVALGQAPQNMSVTFSGNDETGQDGDRLKVGETWTLQKLIDFTLLASSNDGAEAVANAVQAILPQETFVDAMNDKATNLGLNSMHFENPSGLDINTTQASAYGSAADVAKLFTYAIENYPNVFEITSDDSATFSSNLYSHPTENTDEIVDKIPGLIASKTGYTDLAGGNLAVVIDAPLGRPIVLVALGSTFDGRFDDIESLARATYAYLALEK